jgi:hypothetical protein
MLRDRRSTQRRSPGRADQLQRSSPCPPARHPPGRWAAGGRSAGDGRSTVSPPRVASDGTATTRSTTVPAAPNVPMTAQPRSASATTMGADRLAAQLSTAETAIRDPATPPGRLPAQGRSQQRAYRLLVRRPRLVPKVLARLSPSPPAAARDEVPAGGSPATPRKSPAAGRGLDSLLYRLKFV